MVQRLVPPPLPPLVWIPRPRPLPPLNLAPPLGANSSLLLKVILTASCSGESLSLFFCLADMAGVRSMEMETLLVELAIGVPTMV